MSTLPDTTLQRADLRLDPEWIIPIQPAGLTLQQHSVLIRDGRIVALLPSERQTMLFSATMPGQIVALARRYMTQPTHIRASDPNDENATVDAIEQHVWRAHPLDKVELIARVLQADGRGLAMIFTRTKRKAQKVSDELNERDIRAVSCERRQRSGDIRARFQLRWAGRIVWAAEYTAERVCICDCEWARLCAG
jgi:hypothetical protein